MTIVGEWPVTNAKVEIKVRPLAVHDLDAILTIDRKIRDAGKAITYANLTTAQILITDRKARGSKRATSYYMDLVSGNVSGLPEVGLIAEVQNCVCGFIMGRVVSIGKPGTQVGQILIVGIDPDYQRRGIATKLVNALCDAFHSQGVRQVQFAIDLRDKELLNFAEITGFTAGHLVVHVKSI